MGKTYDAIVIGSGVLGASVAAQLAEGGYRVLILERGDAAGGASGGNLGQISITDRCEPWHMDLALRSLDYYRSVLCPEFHTEYEETGGSVAIEGADQLDGARIALKQMRDFGIQADLYYGEDIHKVEPNLAPEAMDALLYCPIEGKLNPFLTTLAFLEKAKRAGAEFLPHTPVLSFQKQGKRITGVQTPNAVYSAEWVMNCTGPRAAFVGEMAGVPIPIRFHKGTAFVSHPVPHLINGPVVGAGFFPKPFAVRPRRSIGFGAVQTADGSIVIAQSTEECESDDRSVNMPSLQLVARRFLHFYPQLQDLQIVRAWAAVTTYTEDNLPVFGCSAEAKNFFTVAGFKGAFTVAPAVGMLAKEALEGHLAEEYRCFSPDRNMDREPAAWAMV